MNPYSDASVLESRIMSATRLELIQILLEQGLRSVRQASAAVTVDDPRARNQAVFMCLSILGELQASLVQNGSTETKQRMRLYASMQLELLDANSNAGPESFKQVEAAFEALLENWNNTIRLLRGESAGPASDSRAVQDEEHAPVKAGPFVYGDAMGPVAKLGWTL